MLLTSLWSLARRFRYHLAAVFLMAGALSYYTLIYQATDSTNATFYAVTTVETGTVSSGIETTGTIMAAEKLDLDVYKQLSRIDVVNVANGGHVESGSVIVSFDKSDAYVSSASANVAVTEAALNLQTERDNATDPSTTIRTLENQIAGYKKTIADTAADLTDAYRDFLNTNLEVTPALDQADRLADETTPTLSGRYVNNSEGTYTIRLYSSSASSGYSYSVSGLENQTAPVIFGKAVALGTRGLMITFPSDIRHGDTWVVRVPNNTIATYSEARADYEAAVATIKKNSTDAAVALANATQDLADATATDSSNYRNLSVAKAASSLSEAQQRLAEAYDVVQERDIIAPFAGTIEGMENVVVGATPTGGESDAINLGTLISDDFLVTFTLSAADAAKVTVGQKVNVAVTSFTNQPAYTATVTHVSSLPEESGVAQYEVLAHLDYNHATATEKLREGMIADIEVVQEEKSDVLRIPTTAVTYEGRTATVTVIDSLTDEQVTEVERMGIIRTQTDPLVTYTKEITVGITGAYYTEVTSGLSAGEYIVSTTLATASNSSVVEQSGPGPGRNNSGDAPQPPSN
jgi:multidrug efflux pump subunit AcrA (membrane-fusion protein)